MKTKSRASKWTALLLALSLLVPAGAVYAQDGVGTDKTDVLTNVSAVVKQGGAVIEGGTLPNADNLSIELSFKVPVAGDYYAQNPSGGEPDPSTIVQKGDTADIVLGKGFTLTAVSGDLPILLTVEGSTVIGHVTAFQTDSATKQVTAHIVFDGDVMDDEDLSGISAGFNANLTLNSDAGEDGDGHTTFILLDKTYTIVPPAAETVYTVAKSGTLDLANQRVKWEVTITAQQYGADANASLEGYTFSDDLTAVGAYVNDSFWVSDIEAASPTYTDGTLSYTFPEGTTATKTVHFQTEIPDEKLYAAGEQTISNTAKLFDEETELAKDVGSVTFTPEWITKTGTASDEGSSGVYDPTGRTITWTITANQLGVSLKKAVITDDLTGSGLTFKSATAQKWDAETKTWVDFSPAKTWDESNPPTDGKDYELGDIDSQVELKIITKVPDDAYTTGTKVYKNSASISWDGLTGNGPSTGDISVGIGYNAIVKSGKLDQETGIVTWTVTVDFKGQSVPDPKVYDLLVYGDSIDLSKVTGIPEDIDYKDLKPQYNQKYANAFSGDGTLSNVYVLKDDQDNAVADLLEITGLSTTDPNSFTFDTQILNPEVYAGNKTISVQNTAMLFSANAKLNEATGTVSYDSHMLAKELLQRGADPMAVGDVNDKKTTDASEGFDYVNRSVIFRLSVNADGMDLTNLPVDAQGTKLGKITVTDTLPEGWIFEPIAGEDYFLIYEGEIGINRSVTATGDALDPHDFVTADFNGTANDGKQKTAVFTFTTLDKPYVILVKAKPTDATAAEYFSKTQLTTVTNNLNLQAANWTPGINDDQKVKIDSTVLSKDLNQDKAEKDAELTWTVEYKPYNLDGKGTKIEDTLPEGIELRTDSSGNLVLTDAEDNPANILIYPLTLQSDGSYKAGDPMTTVLGEPAGAGEARVSYDSVNRVLTFYIPNPANAYRFTYVTDITGNSGAISNQVKLYGGENTAEETQKDYTIVEQDGWATLQRGGSLTVTKTDGSGELLSGAEFTLFAADGETVIRRGTVSADGTLKMRAIPVGEYILRETKLPEGYRSETLSETPTDHAVTIVQGEDSKVTTSIDGKTGEDASAITVANYQEGTAGNLTIRKTVAGNAADTTKQFVFTLTLTGADGTYAYLGSGVPDGTIQNGGSVSLAHGQSITVIGLPKDAEYTVTEADSSADGYTTASTGETGVITADETQTAAFTNTRNVSHPDKPDKPDTGSLTISKTVTGTGADRDQAFVFTVTFTGASGSYPYTGTGVSGGTIRSGGSISLSDGQSVTITGLPAGAKYQVSEDASSAQGYTAESTGSSGSISSTQDRTAAFTNTKQPDTTASLTIHKTVTGQGGDLTRHFDFTVTFTGAPDAYPYTGASSGTLRSGDTVSLADGESITITGLPAGAGYTVTEADYTAEGYLASSTGSTGILSAGAAQTAAFTNQRSENPGTPGTPEPPTVDIGDDGVPTGNLELDDPNVPGGGVNSNTPDGSGSVMPKTGISRAETFAKLGLLLFSASLAALSAADFVLRRRYTGKRLTK